jgi:hypothetical protein
MTVSLTREIHDVVVELDLGPVFKHGLERGARALRSFRPRNRQDLVRIHERIRSLRAHATVTTTTVYQQKLQRKKEVVTRTGYAI